MQLLLLRTKRLRREGLSEPWRPTAAAQPPSLVVRRQSAAAGLVGRAKDELPTPALVVDLDQLEGNITRLAAHAKSAGTALRPHAKTHKCAAIARLQVSAGALGVCVATLREAEAMAAGGVGGLLLTSECLITDLPEDNMPAAGGDHHDH